VRFTRAARLDLQVIADYLTREYGGAVSRRFSRSLRGAALSLREHPKRALVVGSIGAHELRRLVSAPYVILYEVSGDDIFVVRILHGAQDIDRIVSELGAARPRSGE
jgi:toxin ParE1/3/4